MENPYKNLDGFPNKDKMIDDLLWTGAIEIWPNWAKTYIFPEMFKTGKSVYEVIYDYYMEKED